MISGAVTLFQRHYSLSVHIGLYSSDTNTNSSNYAKIHRGT